MNDETTWTQQDPSDSSSAWNARQFQIDQTIAQIRTIVQVEVMSITGGGITASPIVSVKPLVKIVDGQNNTTSHGVINNIPVTRIGCGNGSVIADPVVGDVGWLAVADRDSSVVQATQGKESQPGSRRLFDLADGIYIGKLFGGTPTQYLQFAESGINLKDTNNNIITTSSSGISINGLIINQSGQIAGALNATGEITAKAGTGSFVNLTGHEHTANNTPPTPGT